VVLRPTGGLLKRGKLPSATTSLFTPQPAFRHQSRQICRPREFRASDGMVSSVIARVAPSAPARTTASQRLPHRLQSGFGRLTQRSAVEGVDRWTPWRSHDRPFIHAGRLRRRRRQTAIDSEVWFAVWSSRTPASLPGGRNLSGPVRQRSAGLLQDGSRICRPSSHMCVSVSCHRGIRTTASVQFRLDPLATEIRTRVLARETHQVRARPGSRCRHRSIRAAL